jgi:hypothetical protein
MAAVTPTSIKQFSAGSLKGIIASFANTLDDADTWASGIEDIVFVSATQADTAGTQGSTGAGASFSGETVTFHLGEDNSAVELLVLSGSTQ